MANKKLSPEEKKVTITLRLKGRTIEKLRKIKNYNDLVEKLLENYFKNNG